MRIGHRCSIFLGILLMMFVGCAPKSRPNPENDIIRYALLAKRLPNDSLAKEFVRQLPEYAQKGVEKKLEELSRYSGTMEYDDFAVSYPITVTTTLSNGIMINQVGHFDNGIRAFEFFPVFSTTIIDSMHQFNAAGKLLTRSITAVDSRNSLIERYYGDGQLQSRSYADTLVQWHPNRNVSGIFLFRNNEVVKRSLWHPNGQKKEESEWRNDRYHGVVTEWDSLGTLLRKDRYREGVLITAKGKN